MQTMTMTMTAAFWTKTIHYNSQSTAARSRLSMSIPNSFDVFTSGLASIFRLPNGVTVSNNIISNNNNIRLVKLYYVENSKTCRPVREKITEFDLVRSRTSHHFRHQFDCFNFTE
jgi:hypothetical protein